MTYTQREWVPGQTVVVHIRIDRVKGHLLAKSPNPGCYWVQLAERVNGQWAIEAKYSNRRTRWEAT